MGKWGEGFKVGKLGWIGEEYVECGEVYGVGVEEWKDRGKVEVREI